MIPTTKQNNTIPAGNPMVGGKPPLKVFDGPGTGTSDSIQTEVPEQGFVITADALKFYGLDFFNKLIAAVPVDPAFEESGEPQPATIKVSDGEAYIPPEVVEFYGANFFNKILDAAKAEGSEGEPTDTMGEEPDGPMVGEDGMKCGGAVKGYAVGGEIKKKEDPLQNIINPTPDTSQAPRGDVLEKLQGAGGSRGLENLEAGSRALIGNPTVDTVKGMGSRINNANQKGTDAAISAYDQGVNSGQGILPSFVGSGAKGVATTLGALFPDQQTQTQPSRTQPSQIQPTQTPTTVEKLNSTTPVATQLPPQVGTPQVKEQGPATKAFRDVGQPLNDPAAYNAAIQKTTNDTVMPYFKEADYRLGSYLEGNGQDYDHNQILKQQVANENANTQAELNLRAQGKYGAQKGPNVGEERKVDRNPITGDFELTPTVGDMLAKELKTKITNNPDLANPDDPSQQDILLELTSNEEFMNSPGGQRLAAKLRARKAALRTPIQ